MNLSWIYTWKTILPFFLVKTHFSFFCRLRVFAKDGIFPTYGYVFFSTTCWKNMGLLRVSASTRIKYEPKYAYGLFFGILRGLPIIDQKKCQYGFSGIYIYIYLRCFWCFMWCLLTCLSNYKGKMASYYPMSSWPLTFLACQQLSQWRGWSTFIC